MVEATALPVPYQVRFRAGENTGLADTVKHGAGGSAGPRPHELLEAALATCMTITARMALAELGLAETQVTVTVTCVREEAATRFRYDISLDPALGELQGKALAEQLEGSPVRQTLSKPLFFEPS